MTNQNAIRTIRTLLHTTGSVTRTEIETAVSDVMLIPSFADLDRNMLIRETEELYNIRQDDFGIIEDSATQKPWINNRKAGISWGFWNRYRDYLETEKNFPPEVLSRLDRLTDRTLDALFDPAVQQKKDKRGLVVGQVQSGKTSNYTGLICKAVDAGYKLIIVLAGIHNSLRSQTQFRLDEGFLGFDTQHRRAFDRSNIWIGVGRISKEQIAHSLTSSLGNGDFTSGAANALGVNFMTNEPIIAVVKKNHNVLERLRQWLSAQATTVNGTRIINSKSLLLIDDEADNASINTKITDTTRINGLIRDILRLFDRSGYVGYTATPFANIFIPIDDDNLFPRDFIINIPAPSNYIGPEKVFGSSFTDNDAFSDTTLPVVNRIDDHASFLPSPHRNTDPLPASVPDSLKLAVRCFIITCAVRRLRGQENAHNSMLIHVTRFTRWQERIRELVQNVSDFYRRGIEFGTPEIIAEMRSTYENDTDAYRSYPTVSGLILASASLRGIALQVQVHTWEDVAAHLHEAASRIRVNTINGGSADVLNYVDNPGGLSVIAIGGDKLSRGLTLEGLSVSYYLRASTMYDTLMQMGRWFGYRPGYADLCRLFTSRDLNDWFCHITKASEELRADFDYMSDVAGSTPRDYALRVRTDPAGILQISASNKMREGVTVRVTWSGKLVETYQFQRNRDVLQSNLEATSDFIRSFVQPPESVGAGPNYLWRNISPQPVLDFLARFSVCESLRSADPQNISEYIRKLIPHGELVNWSVALISKANADKPYTFTINGTGTNTGCVIRRFDDNRSGGSYFLRKQRLGSAADEVIDLSDDTKSGALQRTREKRPAASYANTNIVRNEFRSADNPLLLIYLVDMRDNAGNFAEDLPVAGYSISFPKSNLPDSTVEFAVHQQLLPVFNIIRDDEEEVDDDE
jgi:hypothetical protein